MSIQDNHFASVTTPLGSDILLFSRMSGYEEMSRLFEYEVDLLVESKNIGSIRKNGFRINDVLGQAMTVAVSLAPSDTLPFGDTRYFHGLVTQFRHHGVTDDCFLYRAVLRPWLWFLTRTSNCRIFQELSVPDIIKKVFDANKFSDFILDLPPDKYKHRNYCVQYRETDFNFVSRLMENEGIFYFFKHEKDKHTLVITDSDNYQTIKGYETIPYFPPENTERRKQDHIFEWHSSHKVQSGAYVLNDYDFKKSKSVLVAKFQRTKQYSHAEGEQYDYPGNYRDEDKDEGLDLASGERYSNVRLDELQTDYEVIQGRGNALGLTTGMLFSLKDHYITPENTGHIVTQANFLIVSNQYRSGSAKETHYECSFKAIPSTQQFRPQRLTPVPFVQGPQTATVVGDKDNKVEEIWTDKYGRVKVQFHWDKDGKKNETSSCWIRVATPIAGKNWGWISLPRKDQEVVVSFLEGNPDRPLITGSVYNNTQMPPYTLPANRTQSGIKTRSSNGGFDANFNEIRFEDKKGHEEIHIQAERNLSTTVEASESRSVGGSRSTTIQKDETLTIKEGNRTETLEKGNDTLTIKQGNHSETLDKGNSSLKATLGNITIEAPAGKYSVSAKDVAITGTASVKIVCGGSSIEMTPATITIKSPTIEINGSILTTVKGTLVKINC